MIRNLCVALTVILLITSNSYAGFYSSYSRESGSIVAAVEIKDHGIYNLIISANPLSKPQDKKIYKSDAYEELMDRLRAEWRGIALQKVLESKELRIADHVHLKNSIQTEITALAERLKKKLLPEPNVEVVFSISNFYLLEPKDR
jgi:hypothetical protein